MLLPSVTHGLLLALTRLKKHHTSLLLSKVFIYLCIYRLSFFYSIFIYLFLVQQEIHVPLHLKLAKMHETGLVQTLLDACC